MYIALKNSGIRFFISLPCKHLASLIKYLENDKDISYIPVTREEEGVGIAAGSYLGGQMAVMLMQNSGLGNSINALSSLMNYYQIPMILLISHRGTAGEKISAQVPMGRSTEGLLTTLDIPFFKYETKQDIINLKDHISYAFVCEKPIALLVSPQFWSSS